MYSLVIKNNFLIENNYNIFEKNNIQTGQYYRKYIETTCHEEKKYKFSKDCNEVADDVMKNGILLGCHHGLSIKDINFICKTFEKFSNK